MLSKITCLIFDFDGVLADTDSGRFLTLKNILKNYDIKLAHSFSKTDLIGLSTKAFLVKYAKNLTQKQIKEIEYKRHELFFSNLSTYCLPYEKMKESIKFLSSKYDLAIVTTNSAENVKIMLEHLKIINSFKWIIGRENSEDKDFVKTYDLVPKLLGKAISECIVIEDSNYGVFAAKRKGFICIRFDPENIFEKGCVDYEVRSYNELIEVLVNVQVDKVFIPKSF